MIDFTRLPADYYNYWNNKGGFPGVMFGIMLLILIGLGIYFMLDRRK
jgi:hypothetical protein